MVPTLLLAALLTSATEREVGEVGQCDPVDGPGYVWTADARSETRARVRAVCRHVKASEAVCDYLDTVVVRESSGRPGVRHDGGRGLGPMGLLIASHHDKWPGDDEDPAFCQPEVSALVALAVMRRAVIRYHAHDLVTVQSIYGGRWQCYAHPGEPRLCFATQTSNPRLCAALEARGSDCHAPLRLEDLGRRVPKSKRREVANRLAESFENTLEASA